MPLENVFGALALDATAARRYSGGKTAYAGVLATSGANIVIPVAVGDFARVVWVAFVPNPDNTNANLVTVGFSGGVTMYTGYAMAHWESFDGLDGQDVIVTLTTAEPVAVTVHYEMVV